MAIGDSYQNYLVESLKDSEEAAAYIEAIRVDPILVG